MQNGREYMNLLKEIEFSDGAKVKIYPDELDTNPRREWDNLGLMICFHKRYNLGDKHSYSSGSFGSWNELEGQLVKDYNPVVILPLFLMDHSGLSIRTSSSTFRACDSVGWDWGQVGFILAPREKVLREWKKKKVSAKLRKNIENCLLSEVKVYDQYLTGDCYWFEFLDNKGEHIDSCGGFFGTESIADYLPEKYQKDFLASI